MTHRATHRNEPICIGCLGDVRPTRSFRRSGTSTFCSACRASNGEFRWAETSSEQHTDGATALALIDALGFWLDAGAARRPLPKERQRPMKPEATHHHEFVCIGCFGVYRPARQSRSTTPKFCSPCRAPKQESRSANTPSASRDHRLNA